MAAEIGSANDAAPGQGRVVVAFGSPGAVSGTNVRYAGGWRAGGGGSAVSVVPNKRTRPRRSPASVGLSSEERRDVQVALGEPVIALGAQLPGAPAPAPHPRGARARRAREVHDFTADADGLSLVGEAGCEHSHQDLVGHVRVDDRAEDDVRV